MQGYHNKKVGLTFRFKHGEWIAYPTLNNGQIDLDCPFYCNDMDGSSNHGMSNEDKADMTAFLNLIEKG